MITLLGQQKELTAPGPPPEAPPVPRSSNPARDAALALEAYWRGRCALAEATVERLEVGLATMAILARWRSRPPRGALVRLPNRRARKPGVD